MKWYDILYTAVFGCMTLVLILLKVFKVGNRRRGVVKMITSVMFLIVGIYGGIVNKGLNMLVVFGLLFATLGDLLLVFMDNRRYFIAGVLSFSLASLLISVYSILKYGLHWWFVIPLVLLIVANALCQKFKVYSFGQYVVYLNVYTIMVTLCGSLGLSLLFLDFNLPIFLFGLGSFMYLASDFVLGLYLFKFRNRLVDSINSVLYFPGMFLIAISILL